MQQQPSTESNPFVTIAAQLSHIAPHLKDEAHTDMWSGLRDNAYQKTILRDPKTGISAVCRGFDEQHNVLLQYRHDDESPQVSEHPVTHFQVQSL